MAHSIQTNNMSRVRLNNKRHLRGYLRAANAAGKLPPITTVTLHTVAAREAIPARQWIKFRASPAETRANAVRCVRSNLADTVAHSRRSERPSPW